MGISLPTLEEIDAASSFTMSADDGVQEISARLSELLALEGPIEGLDRAFFGAVWRLTSLGREDLGRAMDYIESVEKQAQKLLWRFDDQQAEASSALPTHQGTPGAA